MQKQDKIILWADRVMTCSFYALAFFLPISNALVEWFTSLPFVAFLVKRGRLYYLTLHRNKQHQGKSFFYYLKLFLITFKPTSSPLSTPIAVWIFFCGFSIFFSHFPHLGIKNFFARILQSTFVYFTFIECMDSRAKIKRFLMIFLASFTLIVLSGLNQYFFYFDFIRKSLIAENRISSSLRAPNDFAAYLVLGIPSLITTIFFLKIQKLYKFLLLILLVLAVFCLGMTFSRAAWIACFFGLFILGFRRKKFLIGFLVISAAFLIAFSFKLLAEREHFDQRNLFSMTGRAVYWKEAINMAKDHPIVGVGLNAYSAVGKTYKINWGGYPHNCYLQMLVEIGVPGLFSFLFILWVFFRSGLRQFYLQKDPFLQMLSLGIMAGLASFFLHSFFDTFFYSGQLGSLMWLLMALVVAINAVSSREGGAFQEPVGALLSRIGPVKIKIFCAFLIVCMGGFFYLEKNRRLPQYGEVNYLLGKKCQKNERCSLEKQLYYFQKAVFYDSKHAKSYYEMGLIYEQMAQPEKTLQAYMKVTELSERITDAYFKAARSYFLKGDNEAALKLFNVVWKNEPDREDLHYYLGRIYQGEDVYLVALQHYIKGKGQTVVFKAELALRIGIMHYVIGTEPDAARAQIRELQVLNRSDLAKELQRFIDHDEYPPYLLEKYQESIPYFEKGKLLAHYGETYFKFGNECEEKERCNLKEKMSYYQKAVLHDSQHAKAYYALGLIYKELEAQQRAFESFRKASEYGLKNTDAHFQAARGYFHNSNYDTSLKLFQMVKKNEPHHPDVDYYLGRIFQLKGQYLDALQYYIDGRNRTARFQAESFLRIGILYHVIGTEPLGALDQVDELHVIGRSDLAGQLLKFINDDQYPQYLIDTYSEQVPLYEKGRLLPQYGDVYFKLGTQCEEKENCDLKRKLSYFQKAILHDPFHVKAYYFSALIYDDLNEKAKAFESYQKAANLDDQLTDAHFKVGRYYFGQQEYQRSLEMFLTVLKNEPNREDLHYYLGRVYEIKKNPFKALQYYIRGRNNTSRFKEESYLRIGVLYHKFTKESENVQDIINQLREMNKNDLVVQLQRYVEKDIYPPFLLKEEGDE